MWTCPKPVETGVTFIPVGSLCDAQHLVRSSLTVARGDEAAQGWRGRNLLLNLFSSKGLLFFSFSPLENVLGLLKQTRWLPRHDSQEPAS